jgi:thiosulfate dehydrogenase [quinone] large subunit
MEAVICHPNPMKFVTIAKIGPAYNTNINQSSNTQSIRELTLQEANMSNIITRKGQVVQDPPLVQKLFSDPRAGFLWVLPRIWLGWQWFEAGQHKVTDPGWVQTGESLKAFWERIVVIPETGRPPITFDWYRAFIQMLLEAQAYTWFAKLVAYGELLIGLALILGAFTGIAAFFGGFMNFNFMMAGSASTNPLLFVVAVGLILAWKVSGYVGLDYFLLPFLGTPWRGAAANPPTEKPKTTSAN